MSNTVDLVDYLIKYGRARDFSVKVPEPVKGMMMFNTADGNVYFGNSDGTAWELYTTPSNNVIHHKDPSEVKDVVEAKREEYRKLKLKKEALKSPPENPQPVEEAPVKEAVVEVVKLDVKEKVRREVEQARRRRGVVVSKA